MADIIKVPVKTFPDGEKWLLLDSVLGKRVTLRAHEITLKQNVLIFIVYSASTCFFNSSSTALLVTRLFSSIKFLAIGLSVFSL